METVNILSLKVLFRKIASIFGLATPESRLLVFSVALLILLILPTDKLYLLPIRSIYENFFGFETYSSGMTRSVSKILHGDLSGAYSTNKLAFLVLVLVSLMIIQDTIRLLKSNRVKKLFLKKNITSLGTEEVHILQKQAKLLPEVHRLPHPKNLKLFEYNK